MEKVKVESFNVLGIKVRTNNAQEMNPDTGKIGKLWGDFFNLDLAKDKMDSGEVYGVYFSYESDMNGDFDVLAGIKNEVEQNYNNVSIKEGEYLVFKRKGEMPKAVIDAWMEVWGYFNSNRKEIRAYETDFEKYVSINEVEIYIGIK